ncbi:MAG: hypothetical protein KKB30_00615 [Proteobacteria bacterium]|nr:hypothetical protein [Pseudomonadota bacterium]MBU1715315.1 hypothetical protein [Pseudomonadota bacterium]
MKKDIRSLVDLQSVDLEIKKLDEEMAVGGSELEKQRATIEERKKNIKEYVAKRELCDSRNKEIEVELEAGLEMIKDRQAKLMNVQTNREYQSLLKEIEDAKNSNKQREDESVRLMEQIEFVQNKEEEQSRLCDEEEKSLAVDTAAFDDNVAKLNSKKTKIMKTRDEQVLKVKADQLKRYEQLRERRKGVAVVGVTDGVCLGCFMNVPPQLYNEVLKEDKLHSCPTCNRMLYYRPAGEEA